MVSASVNNSRITLVYEFIASTYQRPSLHRFVTRGNPAGPDAAIRRQWKPTPPNPRQGRLAYRTFLGTRWANILSRGMFYSARFTRIWAYVRQSEVSLESLDCIHFDG